MGINGNRNAVLEWKWVGMGIGMIRWSGKGMGTRKSFPHTSTAMAFLRFWYRLLIPLFTYLIQGYSAGFVAEDGK